MIKSPSYAEITESLRQTYAATATHRDSAAIEPWKRVERESFLSLLQQEGKKTLLEIGPGPGHTSRYFQDKGLDVMCIDLSSAMVALCREKGLTAKTMDVLALDFLPGFFDAVFTLNTLLHIPKRHLPRALTNIRTVLKPNGLFYLGVYGGIDFERIWEDDPLEPKRFFSFHTDEQLRKRVSDTFTVLAFKAIPHNGQDAPLHFQSLVLRRH
jgi:SAM-dependent methyltransferase